jgi:Cu/Ag efflux protein CusF
MMNIFLRAAAISATLLFTACSTTPPSTSNADEWVSAEVVKTDTARKLITLKHGPVASIGMEAMTMPFKVQDAALLQGLKAGDKGSVVIKPIDDELFVLKWKAAP